MPTPERLNNSSLFTGLTPSQQCQSTRRMAAKPMCFCALCLLLDRVLVTPFRTMVVPPPMSAFYLQVAAPVTQVAFCHSATSSNDVAVLLCTGQLVVYTMTARKRLISVLCL